MRSPANVGSTLANRDAAVTGATGAGSRESVAESQDVPGSSPQLPLPNFETDLPGQVPQRLKSSVWSQDPIREVVPQPLVRYVNPIVVKVDLQIGKAGCISLEGEPQIKLTGGNIVHFD